MSLPPPSESFEAAAMARVLDPTDLNYLELSDSTTMPEGNAAPSLGGSSSSAEELASETTSPPCERLCMSCAQELRRRNKCCCCKKRKFENDWNCDVFAECIGEIAEAIREFRELYQTIERECKKSKNDVLERMAKMNEEKEERLQKFMVEQQVVMAKIIADVFKDAVGRRLDSPAD